MKLKIDDITLTLGGGAPYFLDGDPEGLSADLTNINVQIPGTDFSQNVTDYLSPGKARIFTGTLVGLDQSDFRDKKRYLANLVRQTFTFELIDDYKNADGSITVHATYKFIGKLVQFDPNIEIRSNMSKMKLMIVSEDPLFYLLPNIDLTGDVEPIGFTFPLVFPFDFVGTDNSIIFTNSGIISYPTITVTGPLTPDTSGITLKIINETAPIANKLFTYSGSLVALDQLVLTPNPTDPIRARKNGIPVIALTNSNWPALYIYPGVNNFSFFGNGGVLGQTQAEITFNPAFMGI